MFETLTKGFRSARNRLAGKTELSEENLDQALKDVRLSLLEADVELGVAKAFVERVRHKAVGQVVQTKVKAAGKTLRIEPAQRFIKICEEELEAMMAFEGEAIDYAPAPKLTGIMMVGLQGSGKTTSSAKLARLLEKQGRRPLLVAADVVRPGAVEQLQVLGESIDIPVFSLENATPIEISKRAIAHAKKLKCDTIIYDTAGRLALDEVLMQELSELRARVEPQNVFLVVDAMIGQDSVKTADAFHRQLGLSGVILSKLDGDARGGAAISVKNVTGAAIKFVGMGEGLDQLEEFRAEGMASRILGMGDVVGLMKNFEEVIDEKKAEADAKRMLQGELTLEDFLEQLQTMQSMGPMQDLLEKLPFFAESVPEGFQVDEREIGRVKAIVSSMTPEERRGVALFKKQPSRLARVAKGSGTKKQDVAELLQRFSVMKQMMGNIGSQAGMLAKMPGMKQLAAANRLREVMGSGGGVQGNPMLSNLAESLLEAAVLEQPGAKAPVASAASKVSKNKKKAQRKAQRKARRKGRR